MQTFLHVGCGSSYKNRTTPAFNSPDWDEVRFDIDASVNPDITGTMTNMSGVADASVDAVFSSHNIEHLYAHEVPMALKEFLRVLKPDGFVVIACPDLQSVCSMVAEGKLTNTAYTSPAGPIAPLDILYGLRSALALGNLFMAHHCGFTDRVLVDTLRHCGFSSVASRQRAHPHYDLSAVATKQQMADAVLQELVSAHYP